MRSYVAWILSLGALAGGCDPEPASIEISGVRLEGDPGTNHVFFEVTPRDADGQAIQIEGTVTARIVSGDAEVCSFSESSRMFGGATGEVDLFTSPCPPPEEGEPAREVEVLLRSGEAELTGRAALPPDAVWVDPEEVAALRAENEARADAPPPPRRTVRESLQGYADALRRAIALVPEEGDGDAPACERRGASQTGQEEPLAGSALFEPWARAFAAADDLADVAPLPPTSEEPRAFVNRSPLPSVVQVLASGHPELDEGVGDVTQDVRLSILRRNIAQNEPRVFVVRALTYEEPVVRRTGEDRYEYTSGRVEAQAFLVDHRAGRLLCRARVTASNSEGFSVRLQEGRHSTLEEATTMAIGDLHREWHAELARFAAPSSP